MKLKEIEEIEKEKNIQNNEIIIYIFVIRYIE